MSWTTTVNATGYGPVQFDSLAQALPTSLTQIVLVQLGGNKESVCLDLNVGAQPLTHLSLSRTGFPGGTHVVFAADAAINTVSNDIASAVPTAISTLAANGVASIKLSGLRGVQEIGLLAQAAVAGTIQLRGTAVGQV
jgi:hypothetical protein